MTKQQEEGENWCYCLEEGPFARRSDYSQIDLWEKAVTRLCSSEISQLDSRKKFTRRPWSGSQDGMMPSSSGLGSGSGNYPLLLQYILKVDIMVK